MLSLGLFFLMVIRRLSVPSFKSSCPAKMSSMISYMEKVGQRVLLALKDMKQVLMLQSQVLASSCY